MLNKMNRPPRHPGKTLAEFMSKSSLSQYRVAKEIGVPPIRISEIVNEKRSISADTSMRLARLFGTNDDFWLKLQADHDLHKLRSSRAKGEYDKISAYEKDDENE